LVQLSEVVKYTGILHIFSVEIVKYENLDISTTSAISCIVNHRSQYTKVLNMLTFSSVSNMDGLPEDWSLSYDS
jgi:hypothetical protein